MKPLEARLSGAVRLTAVVPSEALRVGAPALNQAAEQPETAAPVASLTMFPPIAATATVTELRPCWPVPRLVTRKVSADDPVPGSIVPEPIGTPVPSKPVTDHGAEVPTAAVLLAAPPAVK